MKTPDIEKAIASAELLARKPKKYDGCVVYLRGVYAVGDGRYGAAKQKVGDGNWMQHGLRTYRPSALCSVAEAEAALAADRSAAARRAARRAEQRAAVSAHTEIANQLQAVGIVAEGSEQGVVLRGSVDELAALAAILAAGKAAQ